MKKADENRYPSSADLFKFCKEALNIKHNFEVKVIDQHVGGILGYDPADCSHWKKGKKNIKSLHVVNTIADHLEVDPRVVTDIIAGKTDLEESIQEYRGFGSFSLSTKFYDDLKREYFRNPSRFSSGGEARTFEQVTDLQRETSTQEVARILRAADVRACPVLIPEIMPALSGIEIRETTENAASLEGRLVRTLSEPSGESGAPRFTILYRAGDMRPHVRFLIAREIAKIKIYGAIPETEDELVSARANLFAMHLLLPSSLLQSLVRQLDHTRDLVGQLAEIFWVSRSIVNARLRDFFTHGN